MRLKPFATRAEFVAAFAVEAAGQIAGAHHIQDADQPAERPRDRPKQEVAEHERHQQTHANAQEHRVLARATAVSIC